MPWRRGFEIVVEPDCLASYSKWPCANPPVCSPMISIVASWADTVPSEASANNTARDTSSGRGELVRRQPVAAAAHARQARARAGRDRPDHVKTIDVTLDGRAIPEVDDPSSLSLDRWATEHGHQRLEPSLAGI